MSEHLFVPALDMSGVVLNLKRGGHVTASAAADDDDDDDDVAGLLAEEEEEDDGTGAEIDQASNFASIACKGAARGYV